MYATTPGITHQASAPPAAAEELPIGIVVSDVADAADYIMASPRGLPTPYYIIRTVQDVPARLGGLAVLRRDVWPDGLAEALSAALLG